MKRNIIVIGAWTGGVKALKELVAGLSPEIDASIFIVWHMPQYAEGLLPRLLEGGPLDDQVALRDSGRARPAGC